MDHNYDTSPFYALWKQHFPRETHTVWNSMFGISPATLDILWNAHEPHDGSICPLHLLWCVNFLCEGGKSFETIGLRWGVTAKTFRIQIESTIPVIDHKFTEVLSDSCFTKISCWLNINGYLCQFQMRLEDRLTVRISNSRPVTRPYIR